MSVADLLLARMRSQTAARRGSGLFKHHQVGGFWAAASPQRGTS